MAKSKVEAVEDGASSSSSGRSSTAAPAFAGADLIEVVRAEIDIDFDWAGKYRKTRFYGEVRNGMKRRWSGATLVVRFYSRDGFVGQDIVRIVPGILNPGQTGTFDQAALGDVAEMYLESEPEHNNLRRAYSFLESR